jgi:hypothetical protein
MAYSTGSMDFQGSRTRITSVLNNLMHGYFYKLFSSEDIARIPFILVIYFGTALISEVINKAIGIKSIGNRAWNALERLANTVVIRT